MPMGSDDASGTYYEMLGVAPHATQDQIRAAYRSMARKYHPDLNHSADAERIFKALTVAYQVLSDPGKRRRYDEQRAVGEAAGNAAAAGASSGRGGTADGESGSGEGFHFKSADFGAYWESVFRRQAAAATGPTASRSAQNETNGQPHRSASEANVNGHRRGENSSATNSSHQHRRSAKGHQPYADFDPEASRQNATAASTVETTIDLTLEQIAHGGPCLLRLDGATESRNVEVRVPRGIMHGQKLRLKGEAEDGGDLLLKVNVKPDARFTLEGRNLCHELRLAPWEAALGCEVTVPTLDGVAEVRIPPGSSTGQKLRLRGHGLPLVQGGTERADLILRLQVSVPKELTRKEQSLFEKLRRASRFNPRETAAT